MTVDESSDRRDLLLSRCAAFVPLLQDGRYFSHVTAARLWGIPLPTKFVIDEPLHVTSVAPLPAARMIGIAGHQSHRSATLTCERHGFPAADPVNTWLSLGALLPADELVVAADHLVLDPAFLDPLNIRPFATIEQLKAGLATFGGRGARTLRRALPSVRVGAESRPETLLRLLIMRSGLPEPALNIAVTSRNGRTLGRGDMVYERWRTVVEYDGDHHRTDKTQYERDILRLESFRDAEWKVVQVRSRGLFVNQQETIARVRTALRAGGWSE